MANRPLRAACGHALQKIVHLGGRKARIQADGPYEAEVFQQDGVRRASGCERAACLGHADRGPPRAGALPEKSFVWAAFRDERAAVGDGAAEGIRDTVQAAAHDLEVIGPDVGDDRNAGAHHGLLGELLQMGLQRHAFEHDGLRSFPGRSADNAHLLVDAGRPPAPDRHFPAVRQDEHGMVPRGFGERSDSGAAQKLRRQAGHGGLAPGPVDVDPQRDSTQTAPVKHLFQGQVDQDNRQKGNIHHAVF